MDKKIIRIAKYLANNGFYKDAAKIIKLAGVKIHNSQHYYEGERTEGWGGKIFEFTDNNGQSFFYNVTTNVLSDSFELAEDPSLVGDYPGQIIVGEFRVELLKILIPQLKGQDWRDVSRRMEETPENYGPKAGKFPFSQFQYGEREYELPDDYKYVMQRQFSTPSLTINGNILKYVESEMAVPDAPGISAINDYNSFTLDLASGRYQSNEISLDTALQILVDDGRVTSGLGGRIARAVMLNRKPYWGKEIKAAEKSGDDSMAEFYAKMMVDRIPDEWLPENGQEWKDDPISAFYSFR